MEIECQLSRVIGATRTHDVMVNFFKSLFVLAAVSASVVSAQNDFKPLLSRKKNGPLLKKGTFTKKLPVRLGSDGRPLLFAPNMTLCQERKSHGKLGKHHYFLSWREPWNRFEDWDWFNGRNFCRERCMDLVSFESPEEFRHFAEMIFTGYLLSFILDTKTILV